MKSIKKSYHAGMIHVANSALPVNKKQLVETVALNLGCTPTILHTSRF